MQNRRTFLKKVSIVGLSSGILRDPIPSQGTSFSWDGIAGQFFKNPKGLLNFNTGSAGIMPRPIYADYIANTKALAESPPYMVKGDFMDSISNSMIRLANMIGAHQEEIALTRNTTMGLCSVLDNYPFTAGDEVLISRCAYPYSHFVLDRLVLLKGIKKVVVDIECPTDSDELIVSKYQQALGPKTKLIIATHVLHREGQIMPIKQICEVAHDQGVEVLADAAHSIGHVPHSVRDLGCDYYITSLHKWLHAPLGTGLLYMKKEHIEKIDPGLPFPHRFKGDMHKYEYAGTVAFQNSMTLKAVLDFHDKIGSQRKYNRLRDLSKYLEAGLSMIPNVKIVTDTERSGGILSFSFEPKIKKKAIAIYRDKYNIHCKTTAYYKQLGYIRATTNIHLVEKDLDHYLEATDFIARQA